MYCWLSFWYLFWNFLMCWYDVKHFFNKETFSFKHMSIFLPLKYDVIFQLRHGYAKNFFARRGSFYFLPLISLRRHNVQALHGRPVSMCRWVTVCGGSVSLWWSRRLLRLVRRTELSWVQSVYSWNDWPSLEIFNFSKYFISHIKYVINQLSIFVSPAKHSGT